MIKFVFSTIIHLISQTLAKQPTDMYQTCQLNFNLLGAPVQETYSTTPICCQALKTIENEDFQNFDITGLCAESCWGEIEGYLSEMREFAEGLVLNGPRGFNLESEPLFMLEKTLKSFCPLDLMDHEDEEEMAEVDQEMSANAIVIDTETARSSASSEFLEQPNPLHLEIDNFNDQPEIDLTNPVLIPKENQDFTMTAESYSKLLLKREEQEGDDILMIVPPAPQSDISSPSLNEIQEEIDASVEELETQYAIAREHEEESSQTFEISNADLYSAQNEDQYQIAIDFPNNDMNDGDELSLYHSQDKTQDPSYIESQPETDWDKLNQKGCIQVSGPTGLLDSVEYMVDGNYKAEIYLESTEPVSLIDFYGENCGEVGPGIAFINKDQSSQTIMIDLSVCKEPVKYDPFKFTSSIEVLNTPIHLQFSLIPYSELGNPDVEPSVFKFEPKSQYYEDYILDWDIPTEKSRQLVMDLDGTTKIQPNNLQFNYFTYEENTFKTRTYSTKEIAAPGKSTFIKIEPTNGFYASKVLTAPELCFLKDLDTNDVVQLWDLQQSDEDHECVEDLKYIDQEGSWEMEINFAKSLGLQDPNVNPDRFALTCNMRVCANVAGNACGRIIKNCGYMK